MEIKSLIKDALVLFAITLVLGIVLSSAKVATQPLIDKANEEAKIKAFNEVCEGYNSADDITADVVGASAGYNASLASNEGVLRVRDEEGTIKGYIVQCTSKGFGGNLNLIVGFDTEGKISGVKYANTPSETPGVGMKTTLPEFLIKWVGHDTNDVNTVDTISGATVSSTAFKEAVSMACMFADRAKTMDGGK